MLIKACLNGARPAAAHPALPVTPTEPAQAALAAFGAGAGAIHIHPRDATGSQFLMPAACGAAITAIGAAVPGLPVGVTTMLLDASGVAQRRADVAAWTVRPDFASVRKHEETG